jgi:L-ascorbate metabolism protein UlaG (beta-lactamase superfamily)
MNKIKVDIAFLPVGGTYTMDYEEASEAANIIKPKYAIPMHYGSIVGSRNDAQNFIKLLKPEIKGLILL